jgi:hypothetical protein
MDYASMKLAGGITIIIVTMAIVLFGPVFFRVAGWKLFPESKRKPTFAKSVPLRLEYKRSPDTELGGIMDIGKVVEAIKEMLEDARFQGYIEIRIMVPSKRAGEK